MFLRILLICALFLIFANAEIGTEYLINEIKYPSNITNLESIHEFVELAKTQELNISVILSRASKYDNGNLRKVEALTLAFPVNNLFVIEFASELQRRRYLNRDATKEELLVLQQYHLRNLLTAAAKEKLAVKARESKDISPYMLQISNFEEGVPQSESHNLATLLRDRQIGFRNNEPSYASHYTFHSPTRHGKSRTTKVLFGDLDVKLVKYSNFENFELNIMKKTLARAYFTYDETFIPEAVFRQLRKLVPDYDWRVINSDGDYSYQESANWARFNILSKEYTIYTV